MLHVYIVQDLRHCKHCLVHKEWNVHESKEDMEMSDDLMDEVMYDGLMDEVMYDGLMNKEMCAENVHVYCDKFLQNVDEEDMVRTMLVSCRSWMIWIWCRILPRDRWGMYRTMWWRYSTC